MWNHHSQLHTSSSLTSHQVDEWYSCCNLVSTESLQPLANVLSQMIKNCSLCLLTICFIFGKSRQPLEQQHLGGRTFFWFLAFFIFSKSQIEWQLSWKTKHVKHISPVCYLVDIRSHIQYMSIANNTIKQLINSNSFNKI